MSCFFFTTENEDIFINIITIVIIIVVSFLNVFKMKQN